MEEVLADIVQGRVFELGSKHAEDEGLVCVERQGGVASRDSE